MTTKTDTYRALLLEDFEPSPPAFFVNAPRPAAAALEPAPAPLPEPRVSKKAFAMVVGMSVRWVEERIAEGMPCEYVAERPRLRIDPAESWLRDHGYLTATASAGPRRG